MDAGYDVVIVGGGVMGSSAAYFLAASDVFDGSILVVERDSTYDTSATARSMGGIRQQFTTEENIAMSMFGAEFARIAPEVLAVDGERVEVTFREQGYLSTATAAGADRLRQNFEMQRSQGAAVTFLEAGDLALRFPWLNPDGLGAAVFGHANEGWIDPNTLLQGFRRKAISLGATFTDDEVVGFTREGDRLAGVQLARGGEVAAGTVVLSAGSRSGALAALMGVDLPVRPRKRYVYVFDCKEDLSGLPLTIDPSGVAFRPEGRQFVTSMSPPEDQDPDSDAEDMEVDYTTFEAVTWPVLANRVPAFEAIKLTGAWAGHYDFNSFDQNAILGGHPEIANLLFCTGFSGHGLQQSPAAGRAISELIVHGAYRAIDLTRFGFERIALGHAVVEANVW